VKETVPSGGGVDLSKNPDGTSTLTWTADGMSPGEARTLIIFIAVKNPHPYEWIGATVWPSSINIEATDEGAAGINVINLKTEDGDVKIGEIS